MSGYLWLCLLAIALFVCFQGRLVAGINGAARAANRHRLDKDFGKALERANRQNGL